MKINRQALRLIMANCDRLAPLLADFTIMEVAEHPVMPIDTWSEQECLAALEWATGSAPDKTPSAIARHLDGIRRDR